MMNNLPVDDRNVPDIVAEFFSQAGSFDKHVELRKWLDEDPRNRKLFDECLDLWQGSLKARKTHDYDEHMAWTQLQGSIRIPEPEEAGQKAFFVRPVFLKIAVAAAIIAFIIILSGYFALRFYTTYRNPLTYSEYSVPYGSKSRMTLPDGSTVWLNAGSKIVFDSQYGIRNRDLKLEGEAHFTVVRTKPTFRVITKSITIEAIGTVFNVKAYPEEKVIETTVEIGAVNITDNSAQEPASKNTVIRTNQKATFTFAEGFTEAVSTDSKTATNAPVNIAPEIQKNSKIRKITVANNIIPEIYTSWKDEKWIIEREELQSLAKKLERRYNVRITFRDELLKKYVFSGALKDETLEQVLEYIKLTAPVGFEIEHDHVIFYEISSLKSQLKGK